MIEDEEDNSQDDKGTIMVNRDNSPYDLLLGGCDNASRVVSYVVVMGLGYDSNPLLDMRIHDINVEADPNTHAPAGPDPVEADGTTDGLVETVSDDTIIEVDNTITDIVNMIESWWGLISFWPVFFISMLEATEEATFDLLIRTDLVGNTEIQRVDISSTPAEEYSEEEMGQIADNLSEVDIDAGFVTLAAILIAGLTWGVKALKGSQLNLPVFIAGLAFWWIGFAAFLYLVDIHYARGIDSAFQCFAALAALLILIIYEMGHIIVSAVLEGFSVGLTLSAFLGPLAFILSMLCSIALFVYGAIIVNIGFMLSMTFAVIILIWYVIKYFNLFLSERIS